MRVEERGYNKHSFANDGDWGSGEEGGGIVYVRAGFEPAVRTSLQLDLRTSDGRACVGWIANDTSSFFHSAF